ncbi:MAG: methyltransferase domain-containing protein [Rikenellaceae bacterium]|nr:methyltransferase domain-containing protein [Rikenellaceae bacterium]
MKKAVRYLLNRIPRRTLQQFVHRITPLAALVYSGSRYRCPVCGRGLRKMLPYGYSIVRSNALCPSCLSLERHRLMWVFLRRETPFFRTAPLTLHIAPERCFIKKFEKQLGELYITGDLESPLAKVKFDVEAIPFGDDTFEVIFCNHILEHVRDDRRAMRELYRVMKPGGWGIFLSPVVRGLDHTREDPSIDTPEKRYEAYGQADHMREYGEDYPERLHEAGFEVDAIDYARTLPPEEVGHYLLGDDTIYLVHKSDMAPAEGGI